jgi:ascorbate-specific PTS system EIIC-type component UlaA
VRICRLVAIVLALAVAIGLLLADKTRTQAVTGLVLVVLGVPVYYVWRGLAPRTPATASAGSR